MLIGLITFILLSAAFLVVRRLQVHLPDDHRLDDSTASVRIAMTVVSTLSAIVLGMVLSSMKTNFDTVQRDVRRFGTEIVMVDTSLRAFGDLGTDARAQLLDYARAALNGTWPQDGGPVVVDDHAAAALIQKAEQTVVTIPAATPVLRYYAARARSSMEQVTNLRATIISENKALMPPIFIIVLVSWFTLLFAGFGYRAPTNLTVTASMLCAAFSIASAVALMTELDDAFGGLVSVSSTPLQHAIAVLVQP